MDRHDLDDLLSPAALSGHEREDIVDRVLRGAAPVRRSGVRLPVAVAAVGAVVCAAAAVALIVRGRDDRQFAARGGSTAGAHVDLVCSGGRLEACPRGSHLVFGFDGVSQPGYLSAYAEPKTGGERIWYFPGAQPSPTIVPGADLSHPVGRVIEVGPEHQIGRYLVHVLVTSRPLSRTEALHPEPSSVLTSESLELEIVQ